jgi:hypothetical protein
MNRFRNSIWIRFVIVMALLAPMIGNLYAGDTLTDQPASLIVDPQLLSSAGTDAKADSDRCESKTQSHTSHTSDCCGATCLYLTTNSPTKSPANEVFQHSFLIKGPMHEFVMQLLRPPTSLPV